MNPIEFSAQQAPRKARIINTIILAAVVIFLVVISFDVDSAQGLNSLLESPAKIWIFAFSILAAGLFVLLVSRVIFFKRIYRDFRLSDAGVEVNKKTYPWHDIKSWHILGDSQDERIGLLSIKNTGNFDLLNIYAGMNVYVLKARSGFINSRIRLQVSPERTEEFNRILQAHNIFRESKTRMYFTGTNPWFIVIFAVPFGLFVLIMLIFSL